MASTIRDVAREAGVSVATVSRVLNASGPVREETRRVILAVAERLRYMPNTAARSLSTRRTGMVGVLLPDLYGEFFSEVIRGIDQTVQSNGYHVLISSSHNAREEIEAALRAMRGRVDGLILMAPDLDAESLVTNLPERLPLVLLNTHLKDSTFDSINIDNFDGARRMTWHLLDAGHRRIALITGGARNYDAQERLRGYRAALQSRGLAVDERLVLPGDFTESSGYATTKRLLAESSRPDAVFAANDSMAVGALSALRDAGLRVPDDIAVVGFDDIPIAQYLSPALTTVRVSIASLGVRAAARLFDSLSARERPLHTQEILPTELVVRRSCGGRTPLSNPKEAVS